MKSHYVLRWAGKPARDYLKSLPDSEFKYEGANADEILTALERKTKPKSNEIAAFTKLHSLKQGDMPLSELIQEARRLAELCNYPNDKDRLIRNTIVSGIRSLRAYQKCLDTKDLNLQDCITICQTKDAIHMQVQDCRPECIGKVQNAQTMIPESITAVQSAQTMTLVNILQQSPRCLITLTKAGTSQGAAITVVHQIWTREHLRVCEANNYICGNCNKRGHLDSMCRSRPMHMLEAQSTAQSETTQDYAHSLEIAQQQNSRDNTILHAIFHVQE